jgi:hypothetical protein
MGEGSGGNQTKTILLAEVLYFYGNSHVRLKISFIGDF